MMRDGLAILALCMVFTGIGFAPSPGKPVQQPGFILKNYDNFFSYASRQLKLSQDIVTYNTANHPISKADFLKVLTTGYYLPVRLSSGDGRLHYNLYRMTSVQLKEMGQYIRGSSKVLYENYLREGKPFPAFNLTDINGKRYTSASVKGKVMIINCWFVGCANCEKEMPALNALMDSYKHTPGMIFLAIAPDSKQAVKKFLASKPFRYNQAASQKTFLEGPLHISGYPTHFVVNKSGIIVAAVDTPEEVIYALRHRL